MPTFLYTAKRGPKEVVQGTLDAPNRAAAFNQLQAQGYLPVRLEEANGKAPLPASAAAPAGRLPRGRRVAPRHLHGFIRQLASLVRSQVPVLRSLSILSEQTSDPALRQIITQVAKDIQQGQNLSEALAQHGQVFSPLMLSLVRAGEIGGMLDAVLEQLAQKADRDETMRSKIQAALAYPLFVGAVGIGTVVFLMTYVLPRLFTLFQRFERLPLPTRLLLKTVDVMSWWGSWVVVLAVGTLAALAWIKGGDRVRAAADTLVLKIPLLGSLVRQLELARFARAFGLLLEHGVSVLQAADVAIPVVRHTLLRRQLEQLPGLIRQGGSLAESLKQVPLMTSFVVNTIAIGEESGKAGEAFLEVAVVYEREVERLLQTATSLLEPAMVLGVGAMVGWIVFAVLLPIFELSGLPT